VVQVHVLLPDRLLHHLLLPQGWLHQALLEAGIQFLQGRLLSLMLQVALQLQGSHLVLPG
jgi:hypothetical protein